MKNALNHFWNDGCATGAAVRGEEDRAVLRMIEILEHVDGGLTGWQYQMLELVARRELRQASRAAINPALDEALNSGRGVYQLRARHADHGAGRRLRVSHVGARLRGRARDRARTPGGAP